MRSNYKIGDLVHAVDNRNFDLHCHNLLGLSMTKEFRASTSNIVGTDLSKYKIVGFNQFAVDFMSAIRVHRMPIALNRTETDIIVSPAYGVFAVNNEEEVLPEYLMLWFRRPEFDRYADFRSDSAIRGGFDWKELCATKITLPPIEEQRKIVHDYQVITDRIALLRKMNKNLEEQAQTLFHSLFIDTEDVDCSLSEICHINPSRPLKKDKLAMCFDMATLPTTGSMPTDGELKLYNGGARFQNGDTLLARITPCFENGKAAYINNLTDGEIAFGSTEYIVFSSKGDIPSSFFYFLVRNKKFRDFGMQFMNGSSGRQRISGEEFGSFKMKKPSQRAIDKFSALGERTMLFLRDNSNEIAVLSKIRNLISCRMTLNTSNVNPERR